MGFLAVADCRARYPIIADAITAAFLPHRLRRLSAATAIIVTAARTPAALPTTAIAAVASPPPIVTCARLAADIATVVFYLSVADVQLAQITSLLFAFAGGLGLACSWGFRRVSAGALCESGAIRSLACGVASLIHLLGNRAWRVVERGMSAWIRCVRCARLVASCAPLSVLCSCFVYNRSCLIGMRHCCVLNECLSGAWRAC